MLHNNTTLLVTFFLSTTAFQLSANENRVSMSVDKEQRCISSNGLPDHNTGTFPNSGNPNSISKQTINLCMPINPSKGNTAQQVRGSIGVALNGVQIRPGTADYYDASSRRGFSRDRSSGWNLEGLGARELLGMDNNNAHVDNRGLYHYHGVAPVIIKKLKDSLLGYAADGFPIHYLAEQYTSSYQLKSGIRATDPGGKHDGTYNQDWQFVKGTGDLDQCNGAFIEGKYRYFATDNYPFFPRCLWGEISADFIQKREAGQRPNRTNGKQDNNRNRQSLGRTPPKQAISACQSKQDGDSCSFKVPHRNSTLQGRWHQVSKTTMACRPMR